MVMSILLSLCTVDLSCQRHETGRAKAKKRNQGRGSSSDWGHARGRYVRKNAQKQARSHNHVHRGLSYCSFLCERRDRCKSILYIVQKTLQVSPFTPTHLV